MKSFPASVIATGVAAAMFAAAGAAALAAQDLSTLKVPNGPAFTDFKGYEKWETVATHQTDARLKIMSANPVMMAAFRSGLPAKGKTFPDGSKLSKIEWIRKPLETAPFTVAYQSELAEVEFIEKDSKRFASTDGWAYADFMYDPATKTLKPSGQPGDCGHACHRIVAAQDFVFTEYPPQPPHQ